MLPRWALQRLASPVPAPRMVPRARRPPALRRSRVEPAAAAWPPARTLPQAARERQLHPEAARLAAPLLRPERRWRALRQGVTAASAALRPRIRARNWYEVEANSVPRGGGGEGVRHF